MSDIPIYFGGDFGGVEFGFGCNFTPDYKKSMSAKTLNCNAAFGILLQTGVEDCI